ncbi:T9SS sorting signal type C domain-containing protein [Xanthomarina sp. F1114]|uniref:T9SS sorting signal type C domain-containing protein n=1 Tax=Xanthomarina sp. F1114 TaxID=2996019 RepID=UPI00225DF7D9|nr:T9SS sorting signal type C domain-containing protein [Xanthomarina sp. F1114]MCX7548714.1 T9SS sorting signal type C domain-containing protein [Xanthomarina sp. F1114]
MKKNYSIWKLFTINKFLKISTLIPIICLISINGFSQTTHISPTGDGGFENGTTFASNGWAATTGATNLNRWVCSTGASGFSGARAAYVSNNNATPPINAYTNSASRYSHIYRTITVPANETYITLNFDWKCRGESSYDKMQVWLVPTSYTPSYGTKIDANGTAPTGRIQIGGNYSAQTTWLNSSLNIPTEYAGTTFRIVFEWSNDGSVGTNPPIAIDNISLISDLPPPAPVNNLCNNATALPCGTTNLSGTTNNTTNVAHNTGCTMSNYGVWYTFTGDGNQTTITATGSGFDLEMATTSGNCGALTNIDCDDAFGGSETYTFITTNGVNYYIYIAYWTTGTTTGNFTISRTCTTVTPPPNDEPCAATPVLTNNDFSCSNFASGTVEFASNSGANNCTGTEDDDVWFSFVATSTYHTVDLNNISGSSTDLVHAVYNGTCGTLGTPIVCSDPNSSTLTGLTIGNTYYVQVYTYTASTGQNTDFDICIGTPPPPPANDDPCASISLTVNPDYSCASTTSGTVASATNSGLNPCFGTANNDVWYSFVATNTSHSVDISNAVGSTTDMYHAVYGGFTAPDCSVVAADNISCSDPNSSTVTGLTIGDTYFVQVYTYYSGSATTTFDICIGTPPPPPTNDEPCGAVSLTVNSTCIGTTGSVGSATNSGIDACSGTPNDDVWYSFVATNSSQTVSLFNVSGSTTDMYHAVYGPFTPPDCSVAVADNISCNDSDSTDLTGLTVGATYFVQVFTWSSTAGATSTFNICVTEPCTSSGPVVSTPTLCPTTIIDEQGNNPFIADPFVLDPTVNLDCSLPSITLEVNSNLKETSSYIVEQITYPTSPAPDYNFSILGNGGNQSISTDDYWADSRTNLGFNFCFYENSYNQTLVGPNGVITFNSAIDAGDYAGYSFNANLPSTAGALFEQAIYGVYHDIIPTSLPEGAIKSRTTGSAPCRQFQVSWHDIPMFSDSSRLYTGMIVLHETTNIIEVFIEEKRIENGNVNPWNGGNAIVGIQGNITPLAPNNQYAVAPCRNGLDTNWETTNEAWRFTPSGADITPDSVTWYSASNGGVGSTSIGSGTTINIASPDTYFAVSNYTTCSGPITLTDEIVVTNNSKIWTAGAGTTDWYTDANWTGNAIPTEMDCVIIPSAASTSNISPIVNAAPNPGLGRTLHVQNNGYLELLPAADLVITDDITVDGQMVLRNSSNLIQITNTGITNSGNIQMQRSVNNMSPQAYVYWSSPVDNFSVTAVSPNSNLRYSWIPTVPGNGAGNYGHWETANGIMLPAKGYIIRGISGTNPFNTSPVNTVEFNGVPRNGRIQIPILRGTYTAGDYPGAGNTMATRLDDNWNLVGNPYPSAISAQSFITENAGLLYNTPDPNTPLISGTVYLWRHITAPNSTTDPFYGDYVYNYNAEDYIGHNGTGSNPAGFNGNIAAGQAFFVLMDDGATSPSNLTFNNNMRYGSSFTPHDNGQFYRNSTDINQNEFEKHRIWLDLVAPNNTANSILVGYIEQATNEVDFMFDGHELSETSNRFYSLIDTEEMAIQGRSLPFNDIDTVPLGVKIATAGNYTIAINTLDGLFENTSQDIFLEDTYNNMVHNLRNSPYSFTSEAGTFNNRFILRYTNETLNITDEQLLSGLLISAPGNNYIQISSKTEAIKQVEVFDILGRSLFNNKNINENKLTLNNLSLSNGTYIVKATLINGLQKTQKVVLK